MRQIIVTVPRGQGGRILAAAEARQGRNLVCVAGTDGRRELDTVLVHVPNAEVEDFVGGLEGMPDLHLTLLPQGVLPLGPPAEETPDQVTDVAPRSPIEIYLGGLQSVGSWTAFLGYAAAAGVVVWIGLFTDTVYLLTAAMLIAPFAGPAMNAALATARGDTRLLGRSLLRYGLALAVTIGIAFALSLIMGQRIATDQMVATSLLSSVAFLLPLVAGAAGALNLCQSGRNSLVSGAATGMLVAASLAPPAGTIGMGAAIGEWDLVRAGLFVLALQFVGINVAGAVIFRWFGLTPKGARYPHGRAAAGGTAWAASLVILAALVAWQFQTPPDLQHSTQSQRAEAVIRETVDRSGLAKPVDVEAQFKRTGPEDRDTLLVRIYVQAVSADAKSEIGRDLTSAIQAQLSRRFNAVPLVDVTVLTAEQDPGRT